MKQEGGTSSFLIFLSGALEKSAEAVAEDHGWLSAAQTLM
jgi:hypothetical protein